MVSLQPSQPLTLPAMATADSSGKATFTFQGPPVSLVWTGSTSIPEAPVTSTSSVMVGGTAWGTMQGPNVFGPVQVRANQQLVINAANLLPGVQYQAIFNGKSEDASIAAPVSPAAVPQPILNYGQIIFDIAAMSVGVNEMLDFAVYEATGLSGGVVQWGGQVIGQFPYVQGDNETIEYPADAVTFVICQLNLEYTATGAPVITLATTPGEPGSAAIDNVLAGTDFQYTGELFWVIDSVASPGQSTTVGASSSTGAIASTPGGALILATFAHP